MSVTGKTWPEASSQPLTSLERTAVRKATMAITWLVTAAVLAVSTGFALSMTAVAATTVYTVSYTHLTLPTNREV